MDEKEQPSPRPQAEPQEPGVSATEESAAKKSYKSPTIKRHGNLRMMTQLE